MASAVEAISDTSDTDEISRLRGVRLDLPAQSHDMVIDDAVGQEGA